MKRSLPLVLASFVLVGALGCGGGGGGGKKKPNPDVPGLPDGAVRTYNDVPLTGAVVRFYAATSDAVLAQTTVGSNGLLVGSIPSGARRFSVDASAITTPSVYDVYQYGDAFYSDSITGCYPTLPNSGSGKLDTDVVFFPRGADIVPPAPDGCLAR